MKYAWKRFELFISKWKVYHSHKCLINSPHNIAEVGVKCQSTNHLINRMIGEKQNMFTKIQCRFL
jgi:hypothetical protein